MRRTPRAAVALVLSLLGLAALAGRAGAATTFPAVYQSPAHDEVLTDAKPTFKGFVYFGLGLNGQQEVLLSVKSADHPDRPPVEQRRTVDTTGQSCVPVSFPLEQPLEYNGRYEVTISAPAPLEVPPPSSGECKDAQTEPRGFFMAALPAPPADVAAAVDKATRVVTVTWAKNPEPDVVRYEVLRAKGAEAFQPFGQTSRQSLVDGAGDAGDYRYQVIALRRGAKASDPLLRSAPSAVVTANVPAPPRAPVIGSTRRSGSGTASRSRSASPPDTGFRETLPFAPGSAELEPGEEAAQGPQLEEIGADEERSDNRRNLAALAAGLLITVFVMHLLWVKGEVDREPLEAIGPD